MEIVLHAFGGILTILIIIITGFVLSKRGWFSDDSISFDFSLGYQCDFANVHDGYAVDQLYQGKLCWIWPTVCPYRLFP
jgi:hypothetical protein